MKVINESVIYSEKDSKKRLHVHFQNYQPAYLQIQLNLPLLTEYKTEESIR